MVKNVNVFLKHNKSMNDENDSEHEIDEEEQNDNDNLDNDESVMDSELQYSHVWSENTEDLCNVLIFSSVFFFFFLLILIILGSCCFV